jgi:hypothetical protein
MIENCRASKAVPDWVEVKGGVFGRMPWAAMSV